MGGSLEASSPRVVPRCDSRGYGALGSLYTFVDPSLSVGVVPVLFSMWQEGCGGRGRGKGGDTPLCRSMGDGRLLSSVLGGLHEGVPLLDEKLKAATILLIGEGKLLVMLPQSLLLLKEGNPKFLALLVGGKMLTGELVILSLTLQSMFCTHRGRGKLSFTRSSGGESWSGGGKL